MSSKQEQYRVAVLDDYQNVALSIADWSALNQRADVTVFNDHIAFSRLLLFDDAQTEELADWVASTTRRFSAIYITQGHPDYFFGLSFCAIGFLRPGQLRYRTWSRLCTKPSPPIPSKTGSDGFHDRSRINFSLPKYWIAAPSTLKATRLSPWTLDTPTPITQRAFTCHRSTSSSPLVESGRQGLNDWAGGCPQFTSLTGIPIISMNVAPGFLDMPRRVIWIEGTGARRRPPKD